MASYNTYPWEGASPLHERLFGGYRGLMSAVILLGLIALLVDGAMGIPVPSLHIILTTVLAVPMSLVSVYREKRRLAQMKLTLIPSSQYRKENVHVLHPRVSAQ